MLQSSKVYFIQSLLHSPPAFSSFILFLYVKCGICCIRILNVHRLPFISEVMAHFNSEIFCISFLSPSYFRLLSLQAKLQSSLTRSLGRVKVISQENKSK